MLRTNEVQSFLDEKGIRYQLKGNMRSCVDNYSRLDRVTDNKITWVKNWSEETKTSLDKYGNLIVVCNENVEISSEANEKNSYILCKDQKMVFFEILNEFFADQAAHEGIASTAVVKTDKIGKRCSIGDFTYIGEDVELSDDVQIENHVTIRGNVKIGKGTVIESGAVIGEYGFGFYYDSNGHRKKIPHLGGVQIGDYVEIGANTCIDRGVMSDTIIGNYTKIDNLCHIAHNVEIGEDVMIVSESDLCGSSSVGNRSYIAPGAVIKNQIKIGSGAFVGMQTVAIKDLPDGESIFGVPGRGFKRDYGI